MGKQFQKMKNSLYQRARQTLKIAAALCVLLIFIWGYSLPQDVTIHSHENFDTLDSGWTQVIDGEKIELETLEEHYSQSKSTPIIIERQITDDMVNESVLFYAEHQEVWVTVGGILEYSLKCPEKLEAFGSPGRTWVSVPIHEDDVGKTLQIVLRSNFNLYHGLPSTVFCVDEGTIFAVQTNFLLLRNTAAFIVLGLAMITYLNARLWKTPRMRRFLFTMADLYLMVGLWLCAEVNVLAIWFGRAPISAVVAMLFLRIIPITFYYFFMSMLPYDSWRTKLAEFLVWFNFFAAIINQVVFGRSLIDTIGMNVIIIVMLCVIGLYEIYRYYRYDYSTKTRDKACYAAVILLFATLLECFIYMNYQDYGHWCGIPLTAACIVYAGIAHVILVSSEVETDQAKTKLEEEYHKLNKKPLQQQINAHFLYNTLNTISAYCKTEPDRAYDAIHLMGKYMRAYTHLVNANEYVHIDEEIDLIHSYMQILNMRYDNEINYTIVNNCDDVWVPPLTLQPIVENAVLHGIRTNLENGKIEIKVNPKHQMAEIEVIDNGKGFDTGTFEHSSGVGFKNLESRVLAMGGTMSIESLTDVGTKVRILVPLVNEEIEVDEYENLIR